METFDPAWQMDCKMQNTCHSEKYNTQYQEKGWILLSWLWKIVVEPFEPARQIDYVPDKKMIWNTSKNHVPDEKYNTQFQ